MLSNVASTRCFVVCLWCSWFACGVKPDRKVLLGHSVLLVVYRTRKKVLSLHCELSLLAILNCLILLTNKHYITSIFHRPKTHKSLLYPKAKHQRFVCLRLTPMLFKTIHSMSCTRVFACLDPKSCQTSGLFVSEAKSQR